MSDIPQRIWLTRDNFGSNEYSFYLGKQPTKEKNYGGGIWDSYIQVMHPDLFHALFGEILEPGQGPIEINPEMHIIIDPDDLN